MKIARVKLRSLSPYSQSRAHETPRLEKEGHDDYERRTWRNRLHADDQGQVFIPPMALKFSLGSAARYLRVRIPGRGQSEYGKHFGSGVLVLQKVPLGIAKEDVQGEWLFLNADGRRGSGKRVWRCMPMIGQWEAELDYHVLDETITKDVFARHLTEAGSFIGIGRFRPECGGFYGRYEVLSVRWTNGRK